LRRQGAMMLRRSGDGFAIEAVKPNGFDRPWTPEGHGESEADPGIVRPAARRTIDATPSEADVQADE
jgi:competence protein ComEC